MQIQCHGAAGEVTGSCHQIDASGQRLLVDCGLFQGHDTHRNHEPFPFDPTTIDALILTHAHTDHIGRVPALIAAGFRGEIIASPATCELAALAWLDGAGDDASAKQWVARAWQLARRRPRCRQPIELGGVQITLWPAGHVFGSTSVTIEAEGLRLVCSGDIGRRGAMVLRDPEPPTECDVLLLESTYGDRDHRPLADYTDTLHEMLEDCARDGGNIVIPSFALGRAQELLYRLNDLAEASLIDRFSVIFDSPLAQRYLEVYRRYPELFDDDARMLLTGGDDPFAFRQLRILERGDRDHLPRDLAIIIAASGMCEGGRVLGHLARELPRSCSDVILLGFQTQGTLGRRLADGADHVTIDERSIPVRCRIHRLSGLSAHAGRSELADWARMAARPGAHVVLVHGEPHASRVLAADLEQLGLQPQLADRHRTVEL
jgi:metallo-beta-lactamase family protein